MPPLYTSHCTYHYTCLFLLPLLHTAHHRTTCHHYHHRLSLHDGWALLRKEAAQHSHCHPVSVFYTACKRNGKCNTYRLGPAAAEPWRGADLLRRYAWRCANGTLYLRCAFARQLPTALHEGRTVRVYWRILARCRCLLLLPPPTCTVRLSCLVSGQRLPPAPPTNCLMTPYCRWLAIRGDIARGLWFVPAPAMP